MGNYREKYFAEVKSDHGWYTCRRCGGKFRKKDMDVDHIIPQSKGGSDALYNLQGLCKHCNRSKQADTSDTLPDLIGHNTERVQRKVKSAVDEKKKEVKKEINKKIEKQKTAVNKKIEKQKTVVVEKLSQTFIGVLVRKKK